ncbi:hypothetical protein D3C85_1401950 [compost metagenome]
MLQHLFFLKHIFPLVPLKLLPENFPLHFRESFAELLPVNRFENVIGCTFPKGGLDIFKIIIAG